MFILFLIIHKKERVVGEQTPNSKRKIIIKYRTENITKKGRGRRGTNPQFKKKRKGS